jgi:hypothetical protein
MHCCLSTDNNGYANALQCYVMRTLPTLLDLKAAWFRACYHVTAQQIPTESQLGPQLHSPNITDASG